VTQERKENGVPKVVGHKAQAPRLFIYAMEYSFEWLGPRANPSKGSLKPKICTYVMILVGN
jgi:hypothetical protein